MGHSQKVHEEVYRQDHNLFQMTAWAKFLSLVNDEDISKYRGKSFEELINIANSLEFNEDDLGDHITIREILEASQDQITQTHIKTPTISEARIPNSSGTPSVQVVTNTSPITSSNTECSQNCRTPEKLISKSIRKKVSPSKTIQQTLFELSGTTKRRRRVNFRSQEIDVMRRCFSENIRSGHLPSLNECDAIIRTNSEIFDNRCGRDIYNWVQYNRNKYRSSVSKGQ